MKQCIVLYAVLVSTAFGLPAAPLKIVTVGAPAINCFFSTDCKVTVSDLASPLTIPGTTGSGFLQSRTYVGQPGSPLVGRGAFVYRIDASGIQTNCVIHQLRIDFPHVISWDFNKSGKPSDVWVVTSGGLGSVGPSKASKSGNTITFTFDPPLPAGQSSYFFGLVSSNGTHSTTARISASVGSAPRSVNLPVTTPVH